MNLQAWGIMTGKVTRRCLSIMLLLGFCFCWELNLAYAGETLAVVEDPTSGYTYQQHSWTSPWHTSDEAFSHRMASTQTESNDYVYSLTELQAAITTHLNNRDLQFTIHYTGDTSSIDEESELDSLFKTIFAGDDYLANNMDQYGVGSSTLGNSADLYFECSYLTTREQETYVDQEVERILGEILSPGMNSDQKEAAIHDYIVSHVAYHVAYDESLVRHSAYSALSEGLTVCQGYALLAFKMLNNAGVNTRIITGNTTGPHAWNLVQLDGKWYHLDCTYDDPVPDQPGKITHTYYNLSDQQISSNHSWVLGDYPSASHIYYQEIQERISSNPGESRIMERLLETIELHYVLAGNTASSVQELEEKIKQGLYHHDTTFIIRTLAGVYEAYNLNAIRNYDNAPNTIRYGTSDYLITPEEGDGSGDMLLTLLFTYVPETTALLMNSSSLSLIAGSDHSLQVSANYAGGSSADISNKARYRSSDEAIASIDENGKITAVGAGQAQVTASYGGESASVGVTVTQSPLDNFDGITWQEEPEVTAGKNWTIRFNRAVDENSIKLENIYVLNAQGVRQDTSAAIQEGSDNKVYVTAPGEGYEPGDYWLYIEKEVQSSVGNIALPQRMRMHFIVR